MNTSNEFNLKSKIVKFYKKKKYWFGRDYWYRVKVASVYELHYSVYINLSAPELFF